jgi:hypothetical protein
MTHQAAPTTLQDAPPTHRFVPVSEAVQVLGLSATTIRRRIEAGQLDAERLARPQGTVLQVKVPLDAPVPTTDTPPHANDAPSTPQEAPATPQDAPARTDQLVAVVVPLVAQIDALRLTVERQAERIAEQAETIGSLRAELTAERAKSTLTTPGSPDPVGTAPEPSSPFSRLRSLSPNWRAMLLGLVVLAAMLLLLVVPR